MRKDKKEYVVKLYIKYRSKFKRKLKEGKIDIKDVEEITKDDILNGLIKVFDIDVKDNVVLKRLLMEVAGYWVDLKEIIEESKKKKEVYV